MELESSCGCIPKEAASRLESVSFEEIKKGSIQPHPPHICTYETAAAAAASSPAL